MKRVTAGTLSLIVLAQFFLFPVAAFADQWVPYYPPGSIHDFTFSDNALVEHVSVIIANLGAEGVNGQQMCSAIATSGPCDPGEFGSQMGFITLLPECTTASQVDCVASMAIGTSTSTLVPSTPVGMTAGQTTPGDPALGVPNGSTIGLWTNPLINDGGTDTYSTEVDLQTGFDSGASTFTYFIASINPYKLVSDPLEFTPFTKEISNEGTLQIQYPWGPGNCAFEQAGECGQNEDFPAGTVASMTVRMPSTIGGWFMGRLTDPSVSDSALTSKTSLITVTGGAVTTQTYAVGLTAAQTSSQVLSYILSLGISASGSSLFLPASNPQAFTALNVLRDTANNTASGQLTIWSFASAASGLNGQPSSSCFSEPSQVDGIVSTNALVYQGTTPTFVNGDIKDEVAGMHFDADGTVALGTYDLNIPNGVADCLYGFSNAPISATVSVTDDSTGDQNVATTTVSDSHGWLHVGAYGFNFSDPTISVKLTQAKPRVTFVCVRRTSVKRVTSSIVKCPSGYELARTIACEKGTIIKKVTAISPKCPIGYKRY